MAKRAKPEEIIAKLREVEVRLSQGESVGKAAKAIGVTEQTYYRWRRSAAVFRSIRLSGLRTWKKRTPGLGKPSLISCSISRSLKRSSRESSKPLAQAPSSRTRER